MKLDREDEMDESRYRNMNKADYFDERENAQMINTNAGTIPRFHQN